MIKEENDILNVVFSSDDNYAQHLGAAIYSLLKHNTMFSKVQIFIIENDISDQNKKKMLGVLDSFSNGEISWIDFNEWKKKLKVNALWDIAISAYARIFVATMLPKTISRVLYLDCDMIICDSLWELWRTDLQDCILGAVQDNVNNFTKTAVGLEGELPYFNSGLLLIDLKEWRKQEIEKNCMEFLEAHSGSVVHHDQGILNGVLKENWVRLPITYNLMTIHYIFDLKKMEKYYCDHSKFYSQEEIMNAIKTPKIIHFTPSFTSRPWVKGCKHPLRKMYWAVLRETQWKDATLQEDDSKWYVRLINWRYRNLFF